MALINLLARFTGDDLLDDTDFSIPKPPHAAGYEKRESMCQATFMNSIVLRSIRLHAAEFTLGEKRVLVSSQRSEPTRGGERGIQGLLYSSRARPIVCSFESRTNFDCLDFPLLCITALFFFGLLNVRVFLALSVFESIALMPRKIMQILERTFKLCIRFSGAR